MYPTTFVAIILGFWSIFHLLHSFLSKTPFFGHHIESFTINNNLSISYFHIRWVTTKWNHLFIRIARLWEAKLRIWFNLGIVFAVIAMVSGSIMLAHSLYTTANLIFFKPLIPTVEKPVLSVIVPGVNLPIHDIWYLLPSILISGVLHEIGHAVAAVNEQVQVNGFGLFAFIIYPGAFVDLNANDMKRRNAVSKLRIYCAGVWHNFIICLMVAILLFMFPILMHPFYFKSSSAVVVTYQSPDSPLSGSMGLRVGDKVIMIDSCKVTNVTSWFQCIDKTKKSKQWGSCMSLNKIHRQMSHTSYTSEIELKHTNKGWQDCCSQDAPSTHLCYNYTLEKSKTKTFACLPGRVMVSSQKDCATNSDCMTAESGSKDASVCATAHTEPHLKFIRLIVLRHDSEKRNVLYVGDPTDILRSITVSEMFPRISILPLRMPSILQRFLQYMFSMSAALALLNIVPCFALDGQWAFQSFLECIVGGACIADSTKQAISNVTLSLGTFLLASNLVFGFMNMFIQ